MRENEENDLEWRNREKRRANRCRKVKTRLNWVETEEIRGREIEKETKMNTAETEFTEEFKGDSWKSGFELFFSLYFSVFIKNWFIVKVFNMKRCSRLALDAGRVQVHWYARDSSPTTIGSSCSTPSWVFNLKKNSSHPCACLMRRFGKLVDTSGIKEN